MGSEKRSFTEAPPAMDERSAKRRHRWGPAMGAPAGPLTDANPTAVAMPRDTHLALPETQDPAALQQLKVQREMQLLEQRIRAAAKAQSSAAADADDLQDERRKEYEYLAEQSEDRADTAEEADRGIIDGGTWEHRKRAREMLATTDTAADLTTLNRGKHHIAQYLPKPELDKFLESAEAVSHGKAKPSAEPQHALDASNKGFQMLRKAGWTEGEGLGTGGKGIVAPVNVAQAGGNGQGVGTVDTHEVAHGDDEFDQYRKRMMLAYRFRPNPLNNPRRSYY